MDDRIALRLGALRLARRRGHTREAAWAASRLRLAGVSLDPSEARFAREVRVKLGHALRSARIRAMRPIGSDVVPPVALVDPRSRRRQLIAAAIAALLVLGAVLFYVGIGIQAPPAGEPEGAPAAQPASVAAPVILAPPLRGRTQPGLSAPVAAVESTPAPTEGPAATAPPSTGTGTVGGGTGGGGGGGGGSGTPAPSPTPTPRPTPVPTPTINPAFLMHVQGRVIDSSTRRGIPGVCYGPGIISCAGSPITDQNGNWFMDIDLARQPPNTTWRVVFIMPGYFNGAVQFPSRRGNINLPATLLRPR
jgi:hypothetical protein